MPYTPDQFSCDGHITCTTQCKQVSCTHTCTPLEDVLDQAVLELHLLPPTQPLTWTVEQSEPLVDVLETHCPVGHHGQWHHTELLHKRTYMYK